MEKRRRLYRNRENGIGNLLGKVWQSRAGQAALLLLAAVLAECTLLQASFWSTLFARGEDVSGRTEVLARYVEMEEMESAEGADDAVVDEQGMMHAPDGAVLLRLKGLDCRVDRIHLKLDIPEGYLVRATVFAQDEGNCYVYQLGKGRTLVRDVPLQAWMKIYPYGRVRNLYVRLETADRNGEAAAGKMGELSVGIEGIVINGRIPFSFHPVRCLLLYGGFLLMWSLMGGQPWMQRPFVSETGKKSGKRRVLVAGYIVFLLLLAAFFVRINPACQKNLALHHAQYQELAGALAEGKVSVGEADAALLEVENPYDTIFLQANQIHYQADYAYYEGKYYVYFGIVPELLLYLPYYLITGKDLPNYLAVFVFYAGFIVASAGFVYELMKRFFQTSPLYLYFVGTFMLVGGYSGFYLLLRPDLYHVPIAASCMFATAGLWLYLAGLNAHKKKALFYAAGSFGMALTAGCRPQFVLFALLVAPLFWRELIGEKRLSASRNGGLGKKDMAEKTMPFGGWAGQVAALLLPYAAVAAGLMAYNALRFGSPFDFGASYSMTSNDMTHRGFNLKRIWDGFWYFLFQPPRLEADFPWLRSAEIATDYLGKMISESCFGGIFACSMLTWPLLLLWKLRRQFADRALPVMAALSAGIALFICAADATGAGILQRYSSDISFGIFLAALPALFALEKWARERKVTGAFLCWLRLALFLHLGFLFLIMMQTDGSVNLLTGNPQLFYRIMAAMRV